ncbi:MAG: hypothetical protein KGY38_00855 [Desulfobacterales bacterium]|nr:hypothetical protein [Desulfobacterales bacterium]
MKRLLAIFTGKTFSAGLVLCMVFSAAAAFAQPASSEEAKIVAIGHSRIYSDMESAKRAAVSEGLLSAVQNAAFQILSEKELTGNFATAAGVMVRLRNDFIQGYRILEEYQTEKHYQVLIQATVSKQKIKDAFARAGLSPAPVRMPSVLFMIAEKNIDDLKFDYWWRGGYMSPPDQAALSPIRQVFTQRGFEVIDPSSGETGGKNVFSGLDLGPEPADYEASTVASRLGADIVVVGRATAEAAENRMGEDVRTFKARVNLRVIDVSTGEKLTTTREQAMTVSRNPDKGSKNALADASYQAGKQLADRIASLWRNAAQTADKFTIRVQGENILPHLEKLRGALKEQPGISGLRTKEMTAASAILAVDYEGTAQELANNLLMRSFDSFGVNISGISADGMSVELISR